ncbi:Trifunctional purine biosynthetic protein adenosine-3 [Armadillidium vulgare]|nr:Trifunctional purine biosynthetic protein adenosine-3 [Armadillidium vulgare]
MTYTKSGVDVDKGNKLVNNIKELCSRTNRSGVKGDLTMFGSVFDTKLEGYQNPLLVSGTDGVGTKLKIAIEAGVSDTVGEDLVAMSVNDILVHGAEPLFFLDYFATGKLDKKVHEDVIKGISNGCLLANCSLVGGETAEMPGMYRSGDYDIAGFTVGAVEEDNFLPKLDAMKPGNVIIGIASSGLHSNGFSLIRKIIETLNIDITKPSLFNPEKTYHEELLKPTLIYTPLLKLLRSGLVLGAAHVTGGGIKENILRIIPKDLGVTLDTKWKIPSVYAWLSALGVNSSVLHHTFNLGIGFILIVENENKGKVLEAVDNIFNDKFSKDKLATYPRPRLTSENDNVSAWIIGSLDYKKDEERYELVGLDEALLRSGAILIDNLPRCIPSNRRKRVAVLISGTGTNLQALLYHTINWPSNAEIVLVISNVAGVQGLERAKKANVPTMTIPHKNYRSREEFESEISKVLVSYSVELICLAGFMRILTGSFVREWSNKIINIHPSLLPSFKGKDAQKQALEARVCVTGCTVHFVTEEVDAGRIITQEPVPVKRDDTVETLSERIRTAEHIAFPR